MLSRFFNHRLFSRLFASALLVWLFAGCGSGGQGSKGPSAPEGPKPALSLPLPKGLAPQAPGSDLVLTAKAVIDPGTPGARTVDLAVDLAAGHVTGVIEGVSSGPHTVEIRYFMNQVQVATATLNVDVVPGQNNPAGGAPSAIHYTETVADALFVADGTNQAIQIFDHYSTLPGGTIAPATPTRTLAGLHTGISGPSAGSLFVDSIAGTLSLTNAPANAVTFWDHAATVNGDVAPDRTLAGPATRLNQPTGIAVDPFRNRLYIVNRTGEILIWNDAATLTGEVPPAASVTGVLTPLAAGDYSLSLDPKRDLLYVANGVEILVFEKLGTLTGDHADVAPARSIRMAGAGLSQAASAIDPAVDRLYLSSQDSNGTIYAVTPASSASGDTPPAAVLSGPETRLNEASTLTVAGNVVMAVNQGGSAIEVWNQADQKNGAASPTQTLELAAPAVPTALFYVATQNGPRDQAQRTLTVEKGGSGHGTVTSDLPGINCGTSCAALFPAGSSVTLTAAPQDDSTFDGWSGGVCSGSGPCVVTVDAAKTVTPTFTLKPFSLSVTKVGSGSGSVTSAPAGIDCGSDCGATYNAGTVVTLTARASENSDFTGWSGACSGTGDCVVTINDRKSVTATFTLKRFSLSATKSGNGSGTVGSTPAGISCGAICSATFDFGASVTLEATPSAESDFAGWSGAGCSGTGGCNVTVDAAKSVTATFTLKPLALSVIKAGTGNGGVTSAPAGIACGGICSGPFAVGTTVTLTATPADDSTFTGWSGVCSGTGSCVVTMNAAKSVTATFTLKTFVLTVNKTGNGTVTSAPAGINCGSTCSATYDINSAVTLTATPEPDLNFTGWSGCDSASGTSCTVTVNATKTVGATFTLKTVTLSVTQPGNGSGTVTVNGSACATPCSPTFNVHAPVTLVASPSTEIATVSFFTGWGGACTGSGLTCNITMDTDKAVTATFTLKPVLSLTVTGNGKVNINPPDANCRSNGTNCTQTYQNFTTVVTLFAAAEADYELTQWTGCDSVAVTGTSCTVLMNGRKQVSAEFKLKPLLIVTKSGAGSGTVGISGSAPTITCDFSTSCRNRFNSGSLVTLAATPAGGSVFTGWSGAGINCPGTGNCEITMDPAKTVTATFTAQTALTVTKSGNGSVTSSPAGINCDPTCQAGFNPGTTVTLTATPNPDALFSGWSGACTGTGSCVVTMDAAKAVTATFTSQTFNLLVAKSGTGAGRVTSDVGGIDCGSTCSATYNIHTTVTLTAAPETGSVFAGWTGACTNASGNCVVTMETAQSVTAMFTPTFPLTVSLDSAGTGGGAVTSDSGGINCGTGSGQSQCQATYPAGTSVTLTAAADPLSHFSGWSGGGCSGTGSCVVTIDAAKSVQARFDLLVLGP
ncbi:MAG: hypothetical protein HY282_01620 [Nitrospirae bacterium]|nr:hypothetical protein [Candidatus Manganitrophaceae bacterium]